VILANPLGTAPGYRVTCERRVVPFGGGELVPATRHLVVMPGVPREMKPMFDDLGVPWVRELRGSSEVALTRTFQPFGMSESALDEAVNRVVRPDEARVSFRASFPQI